MRFDDRIATVMALPEREPAARAAKWRQLVDLLAQRRPGEKSEQTEEAFAWLGNARDRVPRRVRQETARSMVGRSVSPDLLSFFASDHPTVAAPLVGGARLSADQWVEILPALTPTARALLRHRRDLAPQVAHALASFGASDLVLSGSVDEAAPRKGRKRAPALAELVDRLEASAPARSDALVVASAAPAAAPIAADAGAVDSFRWETGPEGIILWVEGAPRGPLVGQSIASIGGPYGVDGQSAGAFEKRAPFRNARFCVAGEGVASGDWRISGVPFFDARRGSFLGYRGSARRPRLDEVAPAQETQLGLFGTELPPDSLRQLVHELRTPLNAIIGFAELIDGQFLGPAGAGYRSRAGEIMEQAGRLLAAIDDLDTAARIETRRFDPGASRVDPTALLCRLHEAYEKVANERGASIVTDIVRGLPEAQVDSGSAERMFARMLAATVGLAEAGEQIHVRMEKRPLGGREMICLAVDRPRAIHDMAEQALLDPGYSPDGDWPGAPVLGLGFALRLVRNLAGAVGGKLEVGAAHFLLYLPPSEEAELSTGLNR